MSDRPFQQSDPFANAPNANQANQAPPRIPVYNQQPLSHLAYQYPPPPSSTAALQNYQFSTQSGTIQSPHMGSSFHQTGITSAQHGVPQARFPANTSAYIPHQLGVTQVSSHSGGTNATQAAGMGATGGISASNGMFGKLAAKFESMGNKLTESSERRASQQQLGPQASQQHMGQPVSSASMPWAHNQQMYPAQTSVLSAPGGLATMATQHYQQTVQLPTNSYFVSSSGSGHGHYAPVAAPQGSAVPPFQNPQMQSIPYHQDWLTANAVLQSPSGNTAISQPQLTHFTEAANSPVAKQHTQSPAVGNITPAVVPNNMIPMESTTAAQVGGQIQSVGGASVLPLPSLGALDSNAVPSLPMDAKSPTCAEPRNTSQKQNSEHLNSLMTRHNLQDQKDTVSPSLNVMHNSESISEQAEPLAQQISVSSQIQSSDTQVRPEAMISQPVTDDRKSSGKDSRPGRWSAVDDTLLPTREFISFANWLFDALDRKFEPRNTGLCEMPKYFQIYRWMVGEHDVSVELTRHMYSKNSFEGLAYDLHHFSIPYVLVPQNALGHLGPLEISPDAITPSLIGMTKCESLHNASWPVPAIPALTRLGFHRSLLFSIWSDSRQEALCKMIQNLSEEYAAARDPKGPLNVPDIDLFDGTSAPEQFRVPFVTYYQKVIDSFFKELGTHPDLTKTSVHPDDPSIKSFENLAVQYAASQSNNQSASQDALQSFQTQQMAAMQNIVADQRMLSNTSAALMRDSVGSSSWYDYRYGY